MMVVAIGLYLYLGVLLACMAEDEKFYAWTLFWPIIVIVKAIKELITICTK